MGRVNVNQLEKVENFPSKLSINKALLRANGKGKLTNLCDKHRHGEYWYTVRRQIMKGSIGKNWDEAVKLILEKIPEGFAQEHPWIIERPKVMIQNSVTGYWHWQDEKGRLNTYGYETPKKLKNSVTRDQYYLDIQGRLKWIKGKTKIYKSSKPNKSEKRKSKTFINLVNFLAGKADYYKRIEKYKFSLWKSQTGEVYYTTPTITFKHPTKVDMIKRYDKDSNSWVETDETKPSSINLTLDQFKLWCKTNNKTYFLHIDNKYYTNLKWSFKQ